MARVFISFAHTSEIHEQSVAAFAGFLRSANIEVLIDSDVTSPAGPPEGWPRWMKNQIEAADWTLVFVDETYRRRFDGQVEAAHGRGVNWEGCIITNELYQAATQNNHFIPVVAQRDHLRLIPSELAGASAYVIPEDQEKLAAKIIKFADSDRNADGQSPQSAGGSTEIQQWRNETISAFIREFSSLRAAQRSASVAEVFGLSATPSDKDIERNLEQLVSDCLSHDDFDVKRISLIVAQFDALRDEAKNELEDQKSLTKLQDLLLPLCIHPHVKSEVAGKLEDAGAVVIDEAVALAIGAELVAAPAEGRHAEFRLNDQGAIAGKGLLSFVDAAVGNPDPEYQIGEILKDIAEQLSVSLDSDQVPSDIRMRIIHWADQLKLAIDVQSVRKRCRHYCVVQPPTRADLRDRLVDLLERVRKEVPELVFFELSRKARAKTGEEVVMQILKDRFRNESQK